jgi:hypothetical protein
MEHSNLFSFPPIEPALASLSNTSPIFLIGVANGSSAGGNDQRRELT